MGAAEAQSCSQAAHAPSGLLFVTDLIEFGSQTERGGGGLSPPPPSPLAP